MPALILFGRRWQIGSDDFVIPSFIDLIIRLSWLITSFVIYWINESQFDCTGGYYIKFYFYGIFVISHFIIILDGCLLQSSSCGSIMDKEARRFVPFFLYVRIFGEVISISWSILGVIWICDKTFTCNEAQESLQCIYYLLIFNLVILCIQLLFLIYCFDPFGGSEYPFQLIDDVNKDKFLVFDIDMPIPYTKYMRSWEKRLKIYCCECCGTTDETHDVFREIGKLFGSQLAEDIVRSDILAGLILLNIKEKQDKNILNTINVIENKVINEEPTKQNLSILSMNFENSYEWKSPKYLFHFVKYSLAALGWIFVPPKRMCNSCVCCSCLPKRNYRYPNKIDGDNCCLCWTSGIRDLNNIEFKDIAYATYQNKLFENPFFVAVDHKTNSIVIGIRGTMSCQDVITDMTGWFVEIPGYPSSFKGHHGMLKSSLNLKKKLDDLNIISNLMLTHPGYNLVLTGLSLGAGLATILSLLLRLEYSNLKCYAYSPPGGLLSKQAADYCNEFVISVIYGDDVIARLGFFQFERFKFRLIDALKECKEPKYRILLGCIFSCRGTKTYYERSNSPVDDLLEVTNTNSNSELVIDSKSILFESQISCDTQKYSQASPKTQYPSLQAMYPPGQIFHITKIPKLERKIGQTKWNWRWADRTEFDEIVVSSKMLWDHIPITMPRALRDFAKTESLINPS